MHAIYQLSLDIVSTGKPTYWPEAEGKMPDLLDFAVFKGIDKLQLTGKSCLELNSDHSPATVEYTQKPETIQIPNFLFDSRTNRNLFRDKIQRILDYDTPLENPKQIDTAIHIT